MNINNIKSAQDTLYKIATQILDVSCLLFDENNIFLNDVAKQLSNIEDILRVEEIKLCQIASDFVTQKVSNHV